MLFSIVAILPLNACISLSTPEVIDSIQEDEPEVLRFTTEKIEIDEEGDSYILVAFPELSEDHQFIYDEDAKEWVAIAKLKKLK